ncbi:MAG: phosphopantetheine-binding protein [Desulfovibrio sp.]|jgi:acyl carrier protein|nr:phosphopantetheine-binding protein [Desulfovibrio sp.]
MMDIRAALKKAMVEDLHLEDIRPEDIDDDAPLFGEGLALDSLDAVELTVLLQRHFGVAVEDVAAAKEAFASINALVAYIETNKR